MIPESTVVRMLMDVAELAVIETLARTGALSQTLSKADASRLIGGGVKTKGEAILNRWIKEGLIVPEKDGPGNCKLRIKRLDIEAALRTSNRPSYFKLKDFR